MPKHELEIVRDEHNATINAKRVSLVAASTIYAVVNTGAAGDSTANIGFATVAVSTPTLYAVVNTSAAGVGNSIVTVANPVSLAGNVTLDAGSKTGIVGNVTLSDSKSFIGLTTTVIGSAPTIFAVVNTAAAGDSLNKIGFATVYVSGNVTLSDSKGFIGLTTTVLGSAPTLYAVVNTGAAGDSTANIGFATVNVANTVTVDSELPSAVTLAEGVANPTAPAVGSYLMGWNGSDWSRAFMYAPADNSASDRGILTNDRMMVYDGANWDMLRGDAANGMLVNLGANNDITLATLPDTAGGDLAAINTAVTELAGAVNGAQFDVDLKASDVDLMLGTDFSSVFGTASLILATQADDVVNTSDGIQTSSFLYVFDGTTWDRLRGDSTNGVLVNLGANNDVTVSGSLTSAGNVTNAGTFVVQVDGSALTALQLIDDVIYVDDADWTADTSKHALVGGVTQVAPTANTDGDVTPLITDALRQLRIAALESDLATAGTSHVKKYYTNAGAVTDGIIWSPAAGKRWYLTLLTINVSAACTVTVEDDLAGGDSPVYKAELAANSGVVLPFGADAPMYSGEDAADLIITTSAGNVYVTAVGYEI